MVIIQRVSWQQVHGLVLTLTALELVHLMYVAKNFSVDAIHCLYCMQHWFLSRLGLGWQMRRRRHVRNSYHVLFYFNLCRKISCSVQANFLGWLCNCYRMFTRTQGTEIVKYGKWIDARNALATVTSVFDISGTALSTLSTIVAEAKDVLR